MKNSFGLTKIFEIESLAMKIKEHFENIEIVKLMEEHVETL